MRKISYVCDQRTPIQASYDSSLSGTCSLESATSSPTSGPQQAHAATSDSRDEEADGAFSAQNEQSPKSCVAQWPRVNTLPNGCCNTARCRSRPDSWAPNWIQFSSVKINSALRGAHFAFAFAQIRPNCQVDW